MPVPRHQGKNNPNPARVHIESASTSEALARSRGLTDRDFTLISYLERHRVLTAVQVSRLLFNSDTHARHRLTALYQRGVLARFRREVWPGSQAWRYTLGHVGATLQAATTGTAFPRPAKVTEQVLRLAHAPTTEHLLGVNDFFTLLAGHARTDPHCHLDEWVPESVTAEACAGIVRPDGYGAWTEHHNHVGFFVEYDNDTETLDTLTSKIDKYAELARTVVRKPVLIVVTNPSREQHTHHALARRYPGGVPVPIATAYLSPDHASRKRPPAVHGPVWLRPGAAHRCRLIDLASANHAPRGRSLTRTQAAAPLACNSASAEQPATGCNLSDPQHT